MNVELILPTEMSLETLAERLAGEVWRVLVSDPRERDAYRGTFGRLAASVLDGLTSMRVDDQSLGGVHSVRLASADPDEADALERSLTRAIVRREAEVLSDLRAVRLVTQELPRAMANVLKPYEWSEGTT